MEDEEGRRYLAHYMIDAWRKRGGENFMPATIRRESFSESPEITFHYGGADFRFGFGHTPFNTKAAEQLISDKWEMYQSLGHVLPLPYTGIVAKNDPRSDNDIAAEIAAKAADSSSPFSFPLVVKPSAGSLSRNVFIVKDQDQLVQAIHANRADSSNGDGILIQQYLGDEQGLFTEMRAICLDGRTHIAFDRTTEADIPDDVLTDPARWPGVVLTEVTDPAITSQIDVIAEHLYENYGVSYVTFDMKRDRTGKVWILEGNVAAMGMEAMQYGLQNGRTLVPGLAEKMLDKVVASSPVLQIQPVYAHSGAEPEFS